jgi:diguanylate cyclase (GGDEF)-like protein
MWREPEVQPLLAEWGPQVAGLQKVAKTLFQGFRSGDYFFRQGGEEFLAFLPNVGEKGIHGLAQKIRRQIAELEIPIPGESKPLKVTVSVGVARFRSLSLEDLEHPTLPKTPAARAIEEADEALYAAKERGRNRVVYYWKK